LKRGERVSLRPERSRPGLAAKEWWDLLTMDRTSLTDPAARPRP
jgi:hypothetical protein